MPYCKYCGSVIDSDAVFCTECGKRIIAESPLVQEVHTVEPKEEVVTVRGGTIAVEDVLKPDLEKTQEYMARVTKYRMAMIMLNQCYNEKEEWTDYDLEMWTELEEVMRKKYELPEISIFRYMKPERIEKPQVEQQPKRRRNRSYNKKDTEYWQKFEKKKEE